MVPPVQVQGERWGEVRSPLLGPCDAAASVKARSRVRHSLSVGGAIQLSCMDARRTATFVSHGRRNACVHFPGKLDGEREKAPVGLCSPCNNMLSGRVDIDSPRRRRCVSYPDYLDRGAHGEKRIKFFSRGSVAWTLMAASSSGCAITSGDTDYKGTRGVSARGARGGKRSRRGDRPLHAATCKRRWNLCPATSSIHDVNAADIFGFPFLKPFGSGQKSYGPWFFYVCSLSLLLSVSHRGQRAKCETPWNRWSRSQNCSSKWRWCFVRSLKAEASVAPAGPRVALPSSHRSILLQRLLLLEATRSRQTPNRRSGRLGATSGTVNSAQQWAPLALHGKAPVSRSIHAPVDLIVQGHNACDGDVVWRHGMMRGPGDRSRRTRTG